jgi:prepilin-type N-terminal cleavage/methylation domain-containing protein
MTSDNRGFSLIEVMVAITLLGVIATLVSSGMRLGLDISTRGDSRAERRRAEQTERRMLHSQLQGALPYRYWTEREGKPVEHVAFEGEERKLRFVSRFGIRDGPDSLPRWIQLESRGTPPADGKLVLEERRILSPDNAASADIGAQAEISFCDDVRFEYLDGADERPAWVSSWTGTERTSPLPLAVRLECKVRGTLIRSLIPLDYAASAVQGMAVQ